MATALQVFAYAVTWTSFCIGIVTCILRIYACTCITRKWKPDDYVAVAVGLSLIGALVLWQNDLLLGCAGPEPNRCNYFDASGDLLRHLYVLSLYYCSMHFLIKTAFLTFYLRLSSYSNLRLWVGVGYGLNTGTFIVNMFILVFQCIPVSAAFTPMGRTKAQCMNKEFVLFIPPSMNVLLDIYIFILPIPSVANLRMPTRRRIAVISVFAFGGIAVALSFIRFHSLVALNSINDTSRGIGKAMIVCALEINLAVIALNLPAMRLIWIKKSRDRRSEASSSGRYGASKRQVSISMGSGRTRYPNEMSQVSNPLRDAPLSMNEEAAWGTITTRDSVVSVSPCNHRAISTDIEHVGTGDIRHP